MKNRDGLSISPSRVGLQIQNKYGFNDNVSRNKHESNQFQNYHRKENHIGFEKNPHKLDKNRLSLPVSLITKNPKFLLDRERNSQSSF